MVTSPGIACELYNNFYVNTVNRLVGAIPENSGLAHIPINNSSIFLRKTTNEEVLEIVSRLKNKHSTGEDHISNITLKRIICFVIEPLTYIINASLEEGVFPDKLKIATIKPIPKKGDSTIIENTRPVSILSSFSKIFEMEMKIRLVSFLEAHSIINPNQHGYQKNKSTVSATFDFIKRILDSLDNGFLAIGLFIDLSKAFDCVNHETLLNKMERMGIRGVAYQWCKSYLQNRKQQVKIIHESKEYFSTKKTTKYGVPQGSVLGPLFFLLYVNDLQTYLNDDNISISSYADDTNILLFGKYYGEIILKTEIAFKKTQQFFQENSLTINTNKTHCILFRHKRNKNEYPEKINLDGIHIIYSDSLSFLGVVIDEFMSWEQHIKSLCMKLSKACYTLKELKKIVSHEALIQAYYSNFHSLMAYGIILWGGTHTQEVFMLQKRAIRIMNSLKSDESCRGYFKKMNLLTVSALYVCDCLCFVHKHNNVFSPNLRQHSYETRHKQDFTYPLHSTTVYEKGCYYKCLKMYNLLPQSLKVTSLYIFKRKIKKTLTDCEPYRIEDVDVSVFTNFN
nr:unnamed protein product [Callosobruchus analis]